MNYWPIPDAHADLIASAYLDRVDATADPQDIGLAILCDSLQGSQARTMEKAPREWQRVEAYRFARIEGAGEDPTLPDVIGMVSDTARYCRDWEDTDTCRTLRSLSAVL